jgi:hypothetical protein
MPAYHLTLEEQDLGEVAYAAHCMVSFMRAVTRGVGWNRLELSVSEVEGMQRLCTLVSEDLLALQGELDRRAAEPGAVE